MEAINNLILLGIAISALTNLIIEIEDVKTIKYEWILKICFGWVIVGSLASIFYKHSFSSTILYTALLIVLVNRILIRKKQ
jgi:hypothetical protein